jgi:phosphoribosylformimino-5-aminoimidazole carboxamide ribotide isomerase
VQVIPAVDVLGGRCVRLFKGDYQTATTYSEDPVEAARSHAAAGAKRLHVVDLDAARGGGDNRAVVERMVAGAGVEVEVAGGVRTEADVAAWLESGAAAVVMGTTAILDPEAFAAIAARHPGKVLAALDLAGERPAVKGWAEAAAVRVEALLGAWNELPLAGVILTCVDRDGTLQGPDLAALRLVTGVSRHPVVYGGGRGSLEDVRSVGRAGAAGVILGKALYEGRIDLAAALQLLA